LFRRIDLPVCCCSLHATPHAPHPCTPPPPLYPSQTFPTPEPHTIGHLPPSRPHTRPPPSPAATKKQIVGRTNLLCVACSRVLVCQDIVAHNTQTPRLRQSNTSGEGTNARGGLGRTAAHRTCRAGWVCMCVLCCDRGKYFLMPNHDVSRANSNSGWSVQSETLFAAGPSP
jgi:hypothetical protein